MARPLLSLAISFVALAIANPVAHAGDPPAVAPSEPSALAASIAPPAPPPYSVPWQLRPALAPNVLRIEDSLAFYHDAAGHAAQTNVLMVTGVARVWRQLAVMARVGAVQAWPPAAASGSSFINPVLATFYSFALPQGFRIAAFLGMTLPVGTGGGDAPDAAVKAANAVGPLARSAMDNTMFAVNDIAVIPGVDVAWIGRGFTVQAEATVFQLFRVRGENVQPDVRKTNFTTGLHFGWFFLPARLWTEKGFTLSLGAELRYQRWLAPPKAISSDPAGGPKFDTATVAAGLRGHFKAGKRIILRPGLSYSTGLDEPMLSQGYHIVQFDLPIFFQ